MNNTRKYIFIAGGIIGLIIIIPFMMGLMGSANPRKAVDMAAQKAETQKAESRSAAAAPQDTNTSLQGLLNGGGDKQCEWEGDFGGQQAKGTVYVSGKKFRSEAVSDVPGLGSMTAYVVGDGTNMTIWTSLAPDQKNVVPYGSGEASSDGKAAFNQFAQKNNYRCRDWTVNERMFIAQ